MRSTVIIEHKGGGYRATVQGKFGGGYRNASAGDTAEKAAAHAAREMIRYGQTNPDGGSLVAPAEVLALVPEHLREVDGSTPDRRDKWLQVRLTGAEADDIAAAADKTGQTVSEYVRDRALRKPTK